jgi:AcrR family transcriptional regulator
MPRDSDATRDRLIEAGFRTLSEEGFAGLGINGIARAAGCDKKLIYRYFDGLDGLLDAMGERVADDLAQALAPALAPPPGTYAELIERLALRLLDLLTEDPRHRQLRALELAGPPGAMDRFAQARGRVLRDWMQAARGELRPPEGIDAPALNAALIAAVEGLAFTGGQGLDEGGRERGRAALLHLLRRGYA